MSTSKLTINLLACCDVSSQETWSDLWSCLYNLRGIWSTIIRLCMTLQTVVAVPNSPLVTVPMQWVLIWWLRVLLFSIMFWLWCCWMFFMFKTPELKSGWHVCQTSREVPSFIYFILRLSVTFSRCVVYCIFMLMFKTFDWPSHCSSYI